MTHELLVKQSFGMVWVAYLTLRMVRRHGNVIPPGLAESFINEDHSFDTDLWEQEWDKEWDYFDEELSL